MKFADIRRLLDSQNIKHRVWGDFVGLAKVQVSDYLNKGLLPKRMSFEELFKKHEEFVKKYGLKPLKNKQQKQEDIKMYNEMQNLTPEALDLFDLSRDPFLGIRNLSEVWQGRNFKTTKAEILQTVDVGGMIAVIGESGSGKTTILNTLKGATVSGKQIKIIKPVIVDKFKLTMNSLYDTIIYDLSGEKPERGLESKARQVKRLLEQTEATGYKSVFFLEEAHDITIQMFKLAKRFNEISGDFTNLLAFVFVGQPELKTKFNKNSYDAREVIARTLLVELKPITTVDELSSYLCTKFGTENINHIITEDGLQAILDKLQITSSKKIIPNAYPLSINNLIKKAMNEAANLGFDVVDAEIINNL